MVKKITNTEDDVGLPKSKSQIKREMTERQLLGERLVQLSKQQLMQLQLPSDLQAAIVAATKISSFSAKRRQLQYIGRLMRDLDDVSFIEQFLLQLETKDRKAIAFHHMLETWRERLIEGESEVLTEFINQYPQTDRQHIRQLVLHAKKERSIGKPLGAGKLLFRYLKELQLKKDDS